MTSMGDFQIPRKPLPVRNAYVAVPANTSEPGGVNSSYVRPYASLLVHGHCGDHSQIYSSSQVKCKVQKSDTSIVKDLIVPPSQYRGKIV